MVVTFIIPIRRHLAKYLRPRSWVNFRFTALFDIPYIFDQYNNYKIKFNFDTEHENIRDYYINSKLFRIYRPGNNLPEYLKKYNTPEYTFLKFYFPVQKKKLHYFRISIDREIRYINYALNDFFWRNALRNVLYDRNGTLKQAIDKFYYEYRLTNEDYSKKSFIVMLYKKDKQNRPFKPMR